MPLFRETLLVVCWIIGTGNAILGDKLGKVELLSLDLEVVSVTTKYTISVGVFARESCKVVDGSSGPFSDSTFAISVVAEGK